MPSAPIDLTDLGPLYHDYSFFGATGEQLPGHFAPNQQAKAPILTAYIALSLADVLESEPEPSFVELFCADACYAMVAARLGATTVRGIDTTATSTATPRPRSPGASASKASSSWRPTSPTWLCWTPPMSSPMSAASTT